MSATVRSDEKPGRTYRQVFPSGEAASPAVCIVAAVETTTELADSEVDDPASISASVDAGMVEGDATGVVVTWWDEVASDETTTGAAAALETAGWEADVTTSTEEAEGAARADEAAEDAAEMTASGMEVDGEADCEDRATLAGADDT